MSDFVYSPIGYVVIIAALNILTTVSLGLFHKGKQKVEDAVTTILPQEDAVKVNELLDTIDQLVEDATQNANSQIVIGLKEKNLFTKETAAALKGAVIEDVLRKLGPLQVQAIPLLGPLEEIIAHKIEKYVLKGKDQVNQLIKTTE